MTLLLVKTAAAIVQLAGITNAVAYERLCNYILMSQPSPADSRDVPRSVQPTAANFGAVTVIVGNILMAAPFLVSEPWWLEQIGNVVLTNPPGLTQTDTRSDPAWGDLNNDVLDYRQA